MIDTEKAMTAIKITDSLKEKKYFGYGYHGGGRKKMKEGQAKNKTICIVASSIEIEKIKSMAKDQKKSVSKYIVDTLLRQ